MPKKWRIIDLINWAEIYFKNKKINNPRFEIEWLIRFVLKINRIDVYLNFDKILPQEKLRLLKNVCEGTENVMPALIDALKSGATVGEVNGIMRDVFGTWISPSGV